jgi:hypothetical protein
MKEIDKCTLIKSQVSTYLFIKIFMKIYADHIKLINCASFIFGISVNSLNAYDNTKHYTYFVFLLQILDFVSRE